MPRSSETTPPLGHRAEGECGKEEGREGEGGREAGAGGERARGDSARVPENRTFHHVIVRRIRTALRSYAEVATDASNPQISRFAKSYFQPEINQIFSKSGRFVMDFMD